MVTAGVGPLQGSRSGDATTRCSPFAPSSTSRDREANAPGTAEHDRLIRPGHAMAAQSPSAVPRAALRRRLGGALVVLQAAAGAPHTDL
jgi:hypothetical protein